MKLGLFKLQCFAVATPGYSVNGGEENLDLFEDLVAMLYCKIKGASDPFVSRSREKLVALETGDAEHEKRQQHGGCHDKAETGYGWRRGDAPFDSFTHAAHSVRANPPTLFQYVRVLAAMNRSPGREP